MSDLSNTDTTSSGDTTPVRSTGAVLGMLAAIIFVPLVLLLVFMNWSSSDAGAGANVVDSVDEDRVQAVYLTSDLVYFGQVGDAHGDFFELRDAFYLRRSETAAEGDQPAESTIVPVPVSEEVGGDGDLLVNATEVLRIQTLDDDAEIAKVVLDDE